MAKKTKVVIQLEIEHKGPAKDLNDLIKFSSLITDTKVTILEQKTEEVGVNQEIRARTNRLNELKRIIAATLEGTLQPHNDPVAKAGHYRMKGTTGQSGGYEYCYVTIYIVSKNNRPEQIDARMEGTAMKLRCIPASFRAVSSCGDKPLPDIDAKIELADPQAFEKIRDTIMTVAQ